VDVDAGNFQREVLERSQEVPVLIDFWAPWCGPCKTLGPILEKLAAEHGGRFVLAKIDIDANVELAEAFRVQSVPTVLLVAGGRPVDGFTGALSEKRVREFLAPHLGGASAPDGLARALELEQAGQRAEAIEVLVAHLARAPKEAAPARIALARLLLTEGRGEEAQAIFAELGPAERDSDDARAVQTALQTWADRPDVEALEAAVAAAPEDLAARLEYGRGLIASGQWEPGLEELYETAKRDLRFDDGAPRKALLEAFELLGEADPLTLEYQRRLSHLLCS
jgi:putative thioredoxin